MENIKTYRFSSFWWLIPLIIFDFFYYYFVEHLVERNSNNFAIEIHGEALFFLFIISLISIGCVRLSQRILDKFNSQKLGIKYLLSIFLSFFIYIVIILGSQYLLEQNNNNNSPIAFLFNQSLIFLFLHLIVGNAAIAVSYFKTSKQLTENLLRLEKVKIEKDLKILQQQMSPHFLFNNLNTLISLIPVDTQKAIEFTSHLSAIFRHATDHANKDLISLKEELSFLKNYMHLLTFRFGDSYVLKEVKIASKYYSFLCIPLSLQVVIENVIKHNVGSKTNPLVIMIEEKKGYLTVKNEIRPKLDKDVHRIGVGLNNLNQQYELVSGQSIIVTEEQQLFIVKIPLIKEVHDEDIDN
ncbi:histidine kinase [Algoriphagus sp. SE2]|uniref:sensor histidine kinase n=1 Tax=Algoriphagus sp. SE2 TaxID=3141536 RepID=UPI0031CD39F0